MPLSWTVDFLDCDFCEYKVFGFLSHFWFPWRSAVVSRCSLPLWYRSHPGIRRLGNYRRISGLWYRCWGSREWCQSRMYRIPRCVNQHEMTRCNKGNMSIFSDCFTGKARYVMSRNVTSCHVMVQHDTSRQWLQMVKLSSGPDDHFKWRSCFSTLHHY